MAEAEEKKSAQVETTPAPKPKRKPRAKKAAKKSLADVELELDDEADADDDLPAHYALLDGKTIKLSGTDVTLKVLSVEQQKEYAIAKVEGEMGKKCKAPVTITFKTAAKAEDFFDMCLYAEKDQEELIVVGSKAEFIWA